MTTGKPLFSVIIPTFNRPALLKEAVDSVLSQTYSSFEIVIVDDHSDQNIQEQLEQIAHCDHRIKFIRNAKNVGVSACRNIGLSNIKGEFVIFLDDDDCLTPDLLRIASMEFSGKDEKDILLFSAMVHPASNSKLFHYHRLKKTLSRQPIKKLYHKNAWLVVLHPPQMASMVFKKEVFDRYKFDENINFGEDVSLWLQLIKDFSFSARIPLRVSPGVLIRVHGQNHLSQAPHEKVIAFLEGLKKEHPMEDTWFTSAIDVKVYMRQLLIGELGPSFKTFLRGIRKSPFIFLFVIISQFVLKLRMIMSYQIHKLFKVEI